MTFQHVVSVLLSAVVLGAIAASTALGDGSFKDCGSANSFPGPYKVRADGVSCHQARKVAKRFIHKTIQNGGNYPSHVRKWNCRTKPHGFEAGKTKCYRSGDRIRFLTGG